MHGVKNQHPSVETLADLLTEPEWEELAARSSVGVITTFSDLNAARLENLGLVVAGLPTAAGYALLLHWLRRDRLERGKTPWWRRILEPSRHDLRMRTLILAWPGDETTR